MKNYAGEYLYYLPWYDKENITFLDMARAIELCFRFLEKQLKVVERNLFIETAIEALPIYQRDLGLQISSEVPLEQKRKIIQGYLHYLHEQTTEEVVRELLKSFENESTSVDLVRDLEVDIYNILIDFNLGQHFNHYDIEDLLKKILPAHLEFIMNMKAKTCHELYHGAVGIGREHITKYPYSLTEIDYKNNMYIGTLMAVTEYREMKGVD